jgi:hypothetical protein
MTGVAVAELAAGVRAAVPPKHQQPPQIPAPPEAAAVGAATALADLAAAEIQLQLPPAPVAVMEHLNQQRRLQAAKPHHRAPAQSAVARTIGAAQMPAATTATAIIALTGAIVVTVAIAATAAIVPAIIVASATFGVAIISSTSMTATITATAIGCASRPAKLAAATGVHVIASVANSTRQLNAS